MPHVAYHFELFLEVVPENGDLLSSTGFFFVLEVVVDLLDETGTADTESDRSRTFVRLGVGALLAPPLLSLLLRSMIIATSGSLFTRRSSCRLRSAASAAL